MFVAAFVPDAIEALIALDRVDDAESLVEMMERNGARFDRPWMLAVGARGRAMVLGAGGDIDEACVACEHAVGGTRQAANAFRTRTRTASVRTVPAPATPKDTAVATLSEALATFEAMGARLWAERATTELARTRFGARQIAGLTPSEHRVAELAAKGMTNRDVAATLFISPKTVEANLSRIYRKLGIHSRAELGSRMREPNG